MSRTSGKTPAVKADVPVSPQLQPGDLGLDRALRPKRLAEFVGQTTVCGHLAVFLQAAKNRGESLDHVLLYGPPGLGKTTLAQIIAAEMGTGIKIVSGPVLERPGDLASILTQLEPNDVLFIDEIHRLPMVVEETLYSAMEDFTLDVLISEGADARSVQIPLAPFTLVGATTRAGSLSAPLRDRFGITERLEYYSPSELQHIVTRSAELLGSPVTRDASLEISTRARGTPRIVNRLLRRVRDYAGIWAPTDPEINQDLASRALTLLGVDSRGLDDADRRLLTTLIEFYGGGPVGLDTLAASIGEARDTLEEAVEPYLLQQGFLTRTPRGRQVTDIARAHLATLPKVAKPSTVFV